MTLTLSDLTRAIAKVTSDPKYREACAKLSTMMKDGSPLEDADVLNHLVQRAAKQSRRKFPLTPRESPYFSPIIYLELFAIVSVAFMTVTFQKKSFLSCELLKN
ncbi:hypothetical protein OESDEN_22474 [Oesophagostomum dentatum]|uniref:Uncharacterized protein n=1 Tax=Oesophagostomum dentatum TaxID=61180 RepID=A0A0B1S1Z3_OESDE|nr:hypothetical protein OESDEN_22474 [Oesophagostomum dentatum]